MELREKGNPLGLMLTQLQSEGQVRDGSREALLSLGPYTGCAHQHPQSLYIILVFILYWGLVDRQCCVSFRCAAK